jgi:hypothetical protein
LTHVQTYRGPEQRSRLVESHLQLGIDFLPSSWHVVLTTAADAGSIVLHINIAGLVFGAVGMVIIMRTRGVILRRNHFSCRARFVVKKSRQGSQEKGKRKNLCRIASKGLAVLVGRLYKYLKYNLAKPNKPARSLKNRNASAVVVASGERTRHSPETGQQLNKTNKDCDTRQADDVKRDHNRFIAKVFAKVPEHITSNHQLRETSHSKHTRKEDQTALVVAPLLTLWLAALKGKKSHQLQAQGTNERDGVTNDSQNTKGRKDVVRARRGIKGGWDDSQSLTSSSTERDHFSNIRDVAVNATQRAV